MTILLPSVTPAATGPTPEAQRRLNKNGQPRKLYTPRPRRPLTHIPLLQEAGGHLCYRCMDFLTPESFSIDRNRSTGRDRYCKECTQVYIHTYHERDRGKGVRLYTRKRQEILEQAAAWRVGHPQELLLRMARRRARSKGFPCIISARDIVIPEFCPILGIRLARNIGERAADWNSPTLDRIIPVLGYVPGNVQVISRKANMMKSTYSIADWKKFAQWVLSTDFPPIAV